VSRLFPLFFLTALFSLSQPAGAATRFVQEPQAEACRLWEEAEQALMSGKIDGHTAQQRFKALWPQVVVDDLPSPKEGHWQWMFPLPGHDASAYGESYNVENYRYLDGPKALGYPALRIYLRDSKREGLDERTHKPAPVVSASDGVVVSAWKFWKEGDLNPYGNYVLVLNQQDKMLYYYANLGKLRASTGQLVDKGELLGWLGRTGKDINERHLGTQLRFEVHTYDDGLFYPLYAGRALRIADHVEWPMKDGEVHPHIKVPKVTPTPALTPP
jgi:murein DD-endopeptidase MepM/ murein hydrolase activator NlpD